MHRIKIKKSRYFFYWMNKTFSCADLSLFNKSYSGGITTTKSLPEIGGTTIQDVGPLAAMAGMGIKGEMSGTVCVTFTWYMYIYIYELFIAFVSFVVCSLL